MKVGKIVQVALREIWKNEAEDFTRWLSENLEHLPEAIDLPLEFKEREKKVDESRFSIDIWAMDDDGENVIIENQLERTDHTHLGQIITYAANMETNTVIWITKRARQEHINALNWLNEATLKRFYLLEISAIRIGDSEPAPQLTVICKPTQEMKALGKSKRAIEYNQAAWRARRRAADTLIVPAKKEGFERTFLKEHAWYSIRIREKRIPQIKYIAAYQVSPIKAVTHIAEVKEIIPAPDDPSKYKIIFKGPPRAIEPVPLGSGVNIQSPVYCELSRLEEAEDLAGALANEHYEEEEAA